MDLTQGFGARSGVGPVTGTDPLNFSDEIRQLVTMPPETTGGSFTALLEMPVTQAIELLHFTDSSSSQTNITGVAGDIVPHTLHPFGTLTFPSNSLLLDRAARFSVIATDQNISGETENSLPSNSGANLDRVKAEPTETDSVLENQNSSQNNSFGKRKEREKKVKSSMKKTKSFEEANKLPYVHVRARRGQATDNHSLAERARREKINARMKLLQELVPGCDKIQGTALVLDEIINHVQSLQHQVEMLSMRLAAVNPRIDFNLDSILAAENGSLIDGSFHGETYHQLQQWPYDGYQLAEWGREEDHHHQANFSMGSAILHPNQLKMEL